MIERSHLIILREIERQGSVTAAAEKLHLTQSALTHTIKKLEAKLGGNLWMKDGRKIRLTQSGEYLLQEAKRLLPQLERIDHTLKQYTQNERGTLNIGMECHPCYQWLTGVVAPFLAKYPDIDIDVKQRFQFGGMAALFNHDIDLLVTPDPLLREGIHFEPVFAYEQVLVVNTNHPLTQKALIKPKHLNNETLFTYPVEEGRLDIFQQFLLPANCRPKQVKTLEATDIMLQMVAAGRGVCSLPKWLVEQYSAELPICPLRLGEEGIHKHIYLGQRTDSQSESISTAFIELAKQYVVRPM